MLGVVNDVPNPIDVPPVKVAYQLIVPAEAVAPIETEPGPHRTAGFVDITAGNRLIVTVTGWIAEQLPAVVPLI